MGGYPSPKNEYSRSCWCLRQSSGDLRSVGSAALILKSPGGTQLLWFDTALECHRARTHSITAAGQAAPTRQC